LSKLTEEVPEEEKEIDDHERDAARKARDAVAAMHQDIVKEVRRSAHYCGGGREVMPALI
jgi:hypothetical protein